MGNNPRSGLTYIKWNGNWGAVIVSVGVVVPSEYTMGRNSARVSGSGIDGTRNSNGVCGGTFKESEVRPDGTLDGQNREVVYWFDKTKFLCPLGIAVFKR